MSELHPIGFEMSASNEWTEWHLTANGWTRGTTRTETGMTVLPAPSGSVLICQYIEEHSGYGKGTERVVQSSLPGANIDEVSRLRQLHGHCPHYL